MSAMADADPAHQQSDPPMAEAHPAAGPLRRRSVLVSCAALALVAAAVIGLTLHRSGSPRQAAASQAPLAALVDGVPVTMAAYERQLRFAANGYSGPRAVSSSPTGRTIRRLLEDKAVDLAIAEALIDHQATLHGITVSDAEVSAEVGRMAAAAGGPAAMAEQMRAVGMSDADVRWVARHTLLRNKLGGVLKDPAWLDHMVGKATIIYYVGDGAAGPDQVPSVSLGHPAPPFVAIDLKRRAVSLADLAGRPVVLNFWATWCRYCVDELPMLLRFARQHPRVAVVALDRQEDSGAVRAFIHQHHLEGLTVWLDAGGQASLDYTLPGLPATFFIDRAGRLRWYNFGPLNDAAALAAGADHAARGVNYTTNTP